VGPRAAVAVVAVCGGLVSEVAAAIVAADAAGGVDTAVVAAAVLLTVKLVNNVPEFTDDESLESFSKEMALIR